MDFPISELMDEGACYAKLVEWLHPDGFACPRCHRADRMRVHRSRRPPVLDYRCSHCGRVFNAFTETALHGVKRRPSELVLSSSGASPKACPPPNWPASWGATAPSCRT